MKNFPILLVVFLLSLYYPLKHKCINCDEVLSIFCQLCFLMLYLRNAAKNKVTKIYPYVFSYKFYSFSCYTYIYDQFWVNFFYTWYNRRVQIHSFACGHTVILASLVEKVTILNFTLKG